MRAVFETLGVQDVVSKSVGSSSPYNMVRATFEGLKNIESPRNIASRRGLKVSSVFGKISRNNDTIKETNDSNEKKLRNKQKEIKKQ